jgi:hypothetical protein
MTDRAQHLVADIVGLPARAVHDSNDGRIMVWQTQALCVTVVPK